MEKEKPIYFTKKGLQKLKQEYENLVSSARKTVAQKIQEIREDGEIDENTEFSAALEEQGKIERRITELKEILTKAKVIEPPREKSAVTVGATVVVEVEGERDEFTIVGSVEADPAKGLISNESPVGRALLGTGVNETVVVSSAIKTTYKVLAIK